jgi:hypothetical protein
MYRQAEIGFVHNFDYHRNRCNIYNFTRSSTYRGSTMKNDIYFPQVYRRSQSQKPEMNCANILSQSILLIRNC